MHNTTALAAKLHLNSDPSLQGRTGPHSRGAISREGEAAREAPIWTPAEAKKASYARHE